MADAGKSPFVACFGPDARCRNWHFPMSNRGTSRSVVREGKTIKEGDHSAEGHCSPDHDRLAAGFRRAVARTRRSPECYKLKERDHNRL
jgi:hypothetical protein